MYLSDICTTQKPFTKYEGDLAFNRLRLQTVFTLLKTLLGETKTRERMCFLYSVVDHHHHQFYARLCQGSEVTNWGVGTVTWPGWSHTWHSHSLTVSSLSTTNNHETENIANYPHFTSLQISLFQKYNCSSHVPGSRVQGWHFFYLLKDLEWR